jgi:integrase
MANRMKGVTSTERNGTLYWYARVGGRRVYCGKDEKGRELAEAARSKEIVKRYEYREMSAGLKVKKTGLRTVLDMANWYMTLPTIQQQKGYQRKVGACAHIKEYFGKRNVNQVEGDHMERYREHRKGQSALDGTINLELSILRAMYNLARKRKKIDAESMPGEFVLVKVGNPRRIVTEGEFDLISKGASQDFRDVLICAHESAMRSREIANLTASQVNLDVRHISGKTLDYIDLGIFDTKTGARRMVPVSATLKGVLKRRIQRLEPKDRVFAYTKGGRVRRYNPNKISLAFMRLCQKIGILYGDKLLNEKGERVGIVFHCFRHTRTTKWVEMGFSDELIRRATGHKSLEAYRNYVKITDPSAVMRLVAQNNVKRYKNDTKPAQISHG